ncbi:hypothetical protein V5O48_009347 [Marasmius crinis-equi]|uniref:Secreted protein n=1 Tax=Marasmius crinis-equi TaxID=585013 RepID=A0ABR3FBD5_9AGAR
MKSQMLLASFLALFQVAVVSSLPMIALNNVERRERTDPANPDIITASAIRDTPSNTLPLVAQNLGDSDRTLLAQQETRSGSPGAPFWRREEVQPTSDNGGVPHTHAPANKAIYPGPPTWKREASKDDTAPGPPTWRRSDSDSKQANGANKPGPPTWRRSPKEVSEDQIEPLKATPTTAILNHHMVPGPPTWKA